MTFAPEQLDALKAPLNRAHVKERKQAGRTLSYLEGWMAIAEANRIFGFDAWTSETMDVRCVAEHARKIGGGEDRNGNRRPEKDGWGVSYIAKVRITVEGVVREGIGSGHGIDVDLGLAHESAIKEAETDARKRALMTFGNPFGLALYDKTQANVATVPDEPDHQLNELRGIDPPKPARWNVKDVVGPNATPMQIAAARKARTSQLQAGYKAAKDESWAKVERALDTASGNIDKLLQFAFWMAPKDQPRQLHETATEAWGQKLADLVAGECETAAHVKGWLTQHESRLAELPGDYGNEAFSVLADLIHDLTPRIHEAAE